jgi:8-amino-7-oxononanoate synthase
MMDRELRTELDDLQAKRLHRRLRRIDAVDRPRVTIEGREVLIFGSNDYLGLAGHPDVRRAAAEAAAQWGAGSTGSRLTTGNFALHEDLERNIAAFKGTEAAIVFGSGYAAGVGAIPALVGQGDLILSDALNHASLIDGCRLSRAMVRVYAHVDIDHVRELLADRVSFRRCLIITDGVFSMDGHIAPLPDLAALCAEFGAWLMVDDAHGTGVLGATGRGTMEHWTLTPCTSPGSAPDWDNALREDARSSLGRGENALLNIGGSVVQMGTLSKALGAEGGFIAGSATLIDYLRNKARSFIFSTAPGPPAMAAARASLGIVDSEPERRGRLHANARRLADSLTSAGFQLSSHGATPIISVVVGESAAALALAEGLFENGFYAPAIRPPTVPNGTARLRLSVTAEHTAADVDAIVLAMERAR